MSEAEIMEAPELEDEAMEEAPQKERGQVPVADHMRVLEALLFASAEPLSTNAIRERMPENADVGGLLMALKEKYQGCGVQLTELDGNWAFRTAADLAEALEITKEVQRKLSRAAMETLAIIAYHQPVTRAEVENIRGVVTHKGTLDVLMECGWVKPGRRRETPGRPLTWVTTTAFMDHFGLESMNDLPGLDDLKASGLLDRRPAIETVPGTGDLFSGAADDNEDGEDDADLEDDEFEEADADAGGEIERASGDDEPDDDEDSEDEYEDEFEDDDEEFDEDDDEEEDDN